MSKLHILAQLTAKPGRESELRDALLAMVEPSLAEAGCHKYDAYGSDQRGRYLVDEIWESAAHLEAHTKTPHFVAFSGRFAELLEGELVIETLRKLE